MFFSGSNATVAVTKGKSVLYTDSRYYLQANIELKEPFRLMRSNEDKSIIEFLNNLFEEGKVGLDLKFISYRDYKRMEKKR